MDVIHKLGDRVQKEHNQFLRDSQRIEDRSGTADNGPTGVSNLGGNVDFESLVGRANGATVKADTVIDGWDDDVWGSIFTNMPEVSELYCYILLIHLICFVQAQSPSSGLVAPSSQPQVQSLPASPKIAPPPRLGAKAVPSSSFNTTAFPSAPHSRQPSVSPDSLMQPLQLQSTGSFGKLSPSAPVQQQMQKPNYNIALPTISPTPTSTFM